VGLDAVPAPALRAGARPRWAPAGSLRGDSRLLDSQRLSGRHLDFVTALDGRRGRPLWAPPAGACAFGPGGVWEVDPAHNRRHAARDLVRWTLLGLLAALPAEIAPRLDGPKGLPGAKARAASACRPWQSRNPLEAEASPARPPVAFGVMAAASARPPPDPARLHPDLLAPTRSRPASSPRPSQGCSGSARAPCPGPAAAKFSRAGSRRRWPPAETRSSEAAIPSRDRLEHQLGAVDLAHSADELGVVGRDRRGRAPVRQQKRREASIRAATSRGCSRRSGALPSGRSLRLCHRIGVRPAV
jgi:hypothetical protein